MSYIAKNFRRVDPGGINADDTYHYERLTDGVAVGTEVGALSNLLGFCGCGDPEAALSVVRQALRILYDRFEDKHRDFEVAYARQREAEAQLFGANMGMAYIVWYLLSEKRLTEHGGSVPGWLTPLGKDVLADLDALAAAHSPGAGAGAE